jgi:asparagine synthase (glutamine-hydrolysing)
MSIIYGTRRSVGSKVSPEELLTLASATQRYAPDGTFLHASGNIGVGIQHCHTHARSQLESQPLIDACGNILTLDGRLDNHADLRRTLDIDNPEVPDSFLVLAAFERWGEQCFSRMVGDWALALWSEHDQTLYLARDHAGTRTLYFENTAAGILWSTHLETFFSEGRQHQLDERYLACYLCSQPIREMTPYKGIDSVPPSHYVIFRGNSVLTKLHWDWVPRREIEYSNEKEYEDHFFALFQQSVERRTGTGSPVLAQLSGGMDSTSIVCMSDYIRRSDGRDDDLLDTVSFYDDEEPTWDERPYFTIVEGYRGKASIHIATSAARLDLKPPLSPHFAYLFPGADSTTLEREWSFESAVGAGKYRAILSGLGGDELLGGVPDPLPELSDYLLKVQFRQLFTRVLAWALTTRRPVFGLLWDVVRFSLDLLRTRPGGCERNRPPWIERSVLDVCKRVDQRDPIRHRTHRMASPSALHKGMTWWAILETLPHLRPHAQTRYEYRYPYLDRDLVDFLVSIPREQLARPGRRRSLMRRALSEIIPIQILERRRKAHIVCGPIRAVRSGRPLIERMFHSSMQEALGLIDSERLLNALDRMIKGDKPQWHPGMRRAIDIELWLESLKSRGQPVVPS